MDSFDGGAIPVSAPARTLPGLRPFGGPRRVAPPRPAAAPMAPAGDGDEEVAARVLREIFRADSGYTVLAVRVQGMAEDRTLRVTTCVRAFPGDRILARGRWGAYKGQPQFQADLIRLEIPAESKGIARWLERGAVPGVGKGKVRRLLDRFGADLPGAIGDEAALGEVLGAADARAIARAWTANAMQADLVAELMGLGLHSGQAARAVEQFGAAVRRISAQDPWRFAEVEGIGFPSADRVAQALGLPADHPRRLEAGLLWVLSDALAARGDCALPAARLVELAAERLGVEEGAVSLALPDFVDGARVFEDEGTGLIYPALLYGAECSLAARVVALARDSRGAATRAEAERAVEEAERDLGVELDREGNQLEAAIQAVCGAVVVITGGPGTGKSTTQRVIALAKSRFERSVGLVAPTGRAAKRLAETSGREAKTVHRLLEYNPAQNRFVHDETNPVPFSDLIVDEASMVDLRLASALFQATRSDACVTLVGDFDQLPSVGPGQVLRDVIESGVVPVVRLTKVRRTAEGSGIALAAQRIRQGQTPIAPGAAARGFEMLEAADHRLLDALVETVRFRVPDMGLDPVRDVQVLAAQRKGPLGVPVLNAALKQALNPAWGEAPTVDLAGVAFTVGDRVMQTKNDYARGVYNGEVGTVVAVSSSGPASVNVDFSGVEARYLVGDMLSEDKPALEHAFAATVHKSQGCEFPLVVFVCPRAHARMLTRNLFYTGITRAKSECILLGDRRTVEEGVARAEAALRCTGLRERLREVEAEYTPRRPALWPGR